jgi:hypothetical protein
LSSASASANSDTAVSAVAVRNARHQPAPSTQNADIDQERPQKRLCLPSKPDVAQVNGLRSIHTEGQTGTRKQCEIGRSSERPSRSYGTRTVSEAPQRKELEKHTGIVSNNDANHDFDSDGR